MSNNGQCECRGFCSAHGREFIGVHEDVEYCTKCAADGDTGELSMPWPDACSTRDGKPDASDIQELVFMCERHTHEKLQFISESSGVK